MSAIQQYIKLELGEYYAVSPVSALQTLLNAADHVTPIIFVLS